MKTIKLSLLTVILLLSTKCLAGDFYAYYTKVPGNFENVLAYDDELFGKFADVIVKIDENQKIIFSRKKSYLPYLKTKEGQYSFEEIIPRSGDGDEVNPDRINRYSYVRIIENTSAKVVIHWRYMPDFENIDWDGVVDEYFTVTSDLKVIRTIRKGTEKLDDWDNPANTIVRKLQLCQNGIEEISRGKAGPVKQTYTSVENAPVKENMIAKPQIEFLFDEGMSGAGDKTHEGITKNICEVEGHKTLWKRGVSGTALEFDGYYSGVRFASGPSEKTREEISVEGWVALGAYPFGWAPIAQRSQWGKKGYYLGVSEQGYPGFHIFTAGKWHSIVQETPLELFRWYHITGTFDKDAGELSLFVDGKAGASTAVPQEALESSDTDFMVGLNGEKMPAIEGRVRRGKWPSLFGIDGLIDEVRVYDKSLSGEEIAESFENFKPAESVRDNPDMQSRELPQNPHNKSAQKFGAEYTKIKYYESWDNMWRVSEHPDVLVKFDLLGTRILFWRGTSYGPFLITENGKWVGDQSSENYRQIEQPGLAEGCCEHMSDKQCRHSHVRIIENTDARVVIHWRYGLVDSRYDFVPTNNGWGDWADEYWTIYPDGVAIRHLARGKIWGDSWVETMFLSGPGTKPEDNMNLNAYFVVSPEGETKTLSWENGYKNQDVFDALITMVNPKSEYKTFNIYPTDSSVRVFAGGGGRSNFHWWNHWPAAQITSDGRGARAPDRVAHSSLVWGIPSEDFLLYGFTQNKLTSLMALAKSWNTPPDIRNTDGCSTEGYKQNQRAYIVGADSEALSFTLNCSEERPAVNPCFVVKNWGSQAAADLKINGQRITAGRDFRQGVVPDTDGSFKLVIWLKMETSKPATFALVKQN